MEMYAIELDIEELCITNTLSASAPIISTSISVLMGCWFVNGDGIVVLADALELVVFPKVIIMSG